MKSSNKTRNKKLTITFVELPATVDGRLYGPLSRDVYSLFRLPARCLDLLTAIAKQAGYEDTVPLTPGLRKKGVFSSSDWKRLEESDVVGISMITRTAPPSYEAARLIRSVNPRAKIIFGGPHSSALPAEALRFGDIVVLNEGDHTLVEVLDRLQDSLDNPDLSDVKGIAYLEGDRPVLTPPRPFLTREQLDALPFPTFPREVIKRITHQTICTSRGCPHACEYCSVIQNFGRGYRSLSVDRTVELIKHHLAQSRAPIFFADDNFTANRRRVKAILERCLSEGIRLPKWSCQSRVEAAFDDELLDLMVQARLDSVMVGFESVNDETLKLWHKASSFEKNRKAIERFHAKGIFIHGMFVLGSDVDTTETIDQTIAFAKAMNIDTAQFFAITPIPGPPLTCKMESEGRVLTHDWHLYDAQHVVVQPRRMTPKELQEGIVRAFSEFYSFREAVRRLFSRAPQRFNNALIRFLGRRLVRRIVKETRPHQHALDKLNGWLGRVDELYASYRSTLKDLASKVRETRADLSEAFDRRYAEWNAKRDRFMSAFDEKLKSLSDALPSLGKTYEPFCTRLLEEMRKRFVAETEAVFVKKE